MGIQWSQRPNAILTPAPPSVTGQMGGGANAPQVAMVAPPAVPPTWRRPPVLMNMLRSPAGYPIYLYMLGNGHRVIIEQRPTDAISLRTFIGTGSINENSVFPSALYRLFTGHKSGIAHLGEHVYYTQDNYNWTREVANQGAQFNASTGSEVIQHEMTFNREDLPMMLSKHGQLVLRPQFDPKLIDKEKTNVINELEGRQNSPVAQVQNKAAELLFGRPHFQTHGKTEDIMATTAEDLMRFHQQWYTPTNMITTISGNVDPNLVLMELDRQFGSNPPRIAAPSATTQLALRPGEIRQATVADPQLTNFSVVDLAFPAPPKANPRERVAMEFLTAILGDGSLSLLDDTLRTRQRVVSGVGVSYEPLKSTGSVEVIMHTQPGQEQMALGSALGIFQQLCSQPVSPQKIAEVREKMINGFDRWLDDVESSTMSLGEESMSQSLNYYLYFKELANTITPQDLMAVAQKYLNPQQYAVVFGVPERGQQAQTVQGSAANNVAPFQRGGMTSPTPTQPATTGIRTQGGTR